MVGLLANETGLARDVGIAKDAAQAMTRPSPKGGGAAAITMTTAELHAVFASFRYHALDSATPRSSASPLPEPEAERKQASLSPHDPWRQVAAYAVLAQAVGMLLAADTGLSADGHAPAHSRHSRTTWQRHVITGAL